jgi:hypothetical protein
VCVCVCVCVCVRARVRARARARVCILAGVHKFSKNLRAIPKLKAPEM